MYSKKDLIERDICTESAPELERSEWDIQLQSLEEFAFTHGRIYVKGKLAARGEQKRADYEAQQPKRHYESNAKLCLAAER